MPDNILLRKLPRRKLYEVFKTQEQVDLYEALLQQAGVVGPENTSNAQADATQAIADAAAALAEAQLRLLKADMVGCVAWFACSSAPANWLECNGAVLNIASYPALAARIGNTFGGDGVTTFGVPDLRGEFIRGWDNGRGVDPARTFGSFQTDEFESHTHTYLKGTSVTQATAAAGHDFWDVPDPQVTGATGGSETRPRNVALLPCIHV